jgi:GR25 family glycosyltransferase involved in LPS biosynthesis
LSILSTKVVCINLDRRPDRWQRIQKELARHGIDSVERFAAIDGDTVEKPAGWIHTRGAYGCLLSHVEVVKEARQSGASAVLIFEDDAVLDPDFQNRFTNFIKEVPDDWDMLYLGALHKDAPVKISEHVVRITKANSTYAYALKNTVYDAFIRLNARAEHVLDMNSYELQERFNCYCFMPNLAWVEAEYSDVQNRLEHHWYLEKSLVLFGADMDRLLSQTSAIIAPRDPRDSENIRFLRRYYEEYFSQLVEIVLVDDFETGVTHASYNRNFLILAESDIFIEALDIRANLKMLEQYDAATGYSHVIDLSHDEAKLLRTTGITRGIDVTRRLVSKNGGLYFFRRNARKGTVFQSPNHALRLPRD